MMILGLMSPYILIATCLILIDAIRNWRKWGNVRRGMVALIVFTVLILLLTGKI